MSGLRILSLSNTRLPKVPEVPPESKISEVPELPGIPEDSFVDSNLPPEIEIGPLPPPTVVHQPKKLKSPVISFVNYLSYNEFASKYPRALGTLPS